MTNSAFTHEPTITVPSTTQTGALVRWGDTSGGSFTAFANSTTGISSDGTHLTMLRQGLVKFEGASAVSVNLGVSGTVASSGYNIYLPLAAPGNDKMLQSNSSGQLVWIDTPSGGAALNGSPAEHQIVTVASGAATLDGETTLTYNGTNLRLGAQGTPDALLHIEHASQSNHIKMKSTATDGNAWTIQSRTDGLFRIVEDTSAIAMEIKTHDQYTNSVTFPKQPACLIANNADIAQTTSSSADDTAFNSAVINQGTCYNTSSSTRTGHFGSNHLGYSFQAPVTGMYLFTMTANVKTIASGTKRYEMTFLTRNSSGSTIRAYNARPWLESGEGEVRLSYAQFIYLAAGDNCTARTGPYGGDATMGQDSWFGGCLIA